MIRRGLCKPVSIMNQQKMLPLTNALCSKRHNIQHWQPENAARLSTALPVSCRYENNEQGLCSTCGRPYSGLPLSRKSKRNLMCIGCARLYGQCQKNEYMINTMKYIQFCLFGHGVSVTAHQQLIHANTLFCSKKFQLSLLTNAMKSLDQQVFPTDYNMMLHLFNHNFWNDQQLNISKLLDERATNFLLHSKNRYRKLFPDGKIADEQFIFPAKSQVTGLMEASNSMCAWSGVKGLWKGQSDENLMIQLSVDHIKPVSKQGSWNIDNLQIGLKMYNSVKSNESESEFQRWLFQQKLG